MVPFQSKWMIIVRKLWQVWKIFGYNDKLRDKKLTDKKWSHFNLIVPNARDPLVAFYWIAERNKSAAGPTRWIAFLKTGWIAFKTNFKKTNIARYCKMQHDIAKWKFWISVNQAKLLEFFIFFQTYEQMLAFCLMHKKLFVLTKSSLDRQDVLAIVNQ